MICDLGFLNIISIMKKYLILLVVMTISLASMAVPARRGFHEYEQPDGSVISLTLAGDESMHWYEDAAGTVYYQDSEGTFTAATVTRTEQGARRMAASSQRRAKADVGTEPYPAPRGLLILANFSDVKFKDANDYEVMDSLINAVNCQVNGGYGSAAQYFRDQSNGLYQPVFDVYGPVNLSNKQSYYGQNDSEGNDKYATDAVIEACILANEQYADLNFANYDWNNDGYVDFVYVIYAGKGEADGGASYTIWPHNYSVQTIIQYKGYGTYSIYSKSDTKIDGKYLNNYAMSQEIDGQTGARAGNGTFCHEFGHVIGLPDFYDTSYGTNYSSQLTPNEWDVMDGGAYNGNGHCPPNYSAWEKYFMGWITPENLGSEGAALTLYANGTPEHNVYQINTSGTLEKATKNGLNYYIENRQKDGWDKCLPAAGMLIWKVDFSASLWTNNEPNLSSRGKPHYTLIIPSGTKIGQSSGAKNVWPYGTTNSWEDVSGKPLKEITKNGKLIELIYIEEVVDPFELTWMVNGKQFATTTSTGKVVLPDSDPVAAGESQEFVGWCRTADYESETTAPEFVRNGDPAQEGDIFYAVFATRQEGTDVTADDKLTREVIGVTSSSYTGWSGKKVNSEAVYAGNSAGGNNAIQLRSLGSSSGILSATSGGKIQKIVVDWNENTTSGRSIKVYGKNSSFTSVADLYESSCTELGTITYGTSTELTISGEYEYVGIRSAVGALYLNSITFTWSGAVAYTNYTTHGGWSAVDTAELERVTAVKAVRDGQVVIIRGNEVYNLLGVKL